MAKKTILEHIPDELIPQLFEELFELPEFKVLIKEKFKSGDFQEEMSPEEAKKDIDRYIQTTSKK